jgi:hypothetical protein
MFVFVIDNVLYIHVYHGSSLFNSSELASYNS